MSDDAPTGGLSNDLRAGLGVLALVLIALALLVAGVRYWTDDSPRSALASSAAMTSSPIPLAPGESYVRTEVLASGDLVVTQWINAAKPLDSVLLSPPPRAADTKRVLADQVRVVADELVVEGPELVSGQARRYSFPDASSVQITYRLTGAVERSSSAPGRALARVTSLDVSYDPAPTSVTRSVVARQVLSLACAPPVMATEPAPCGTAAADNEWTVELVGPRAADRVMAQLTLD